MTGRHRPEPRLRPASDEEGAVAVLVALLLVVFVAVGALAIDIGSGWATKRDLVVDLDSAALAGATRLAEAVTADGESQCPPGGAPTGATVGQVSAAVGQIQALNGGASDLDGIGSGSIDCTRMTVTVSGSQDAQTTFASSLGVGEIRPGGYAIAKAVPGVGGDLLPISICANTPQLAGLSSGAAVGTTRTIPFESASEGLCGDTADSHWGYWGAGNANDLRQFASGDQTGLFVQLPPNAVCDGLTSATQPGWCSGDTGHKNNVLGSNGLQQRICAWSQPAEDCELVTFMIHDVLECTGNCGSRAEYRPVAFLDAIIRDVESNPASSASITIEFRGWRTGPDEPSRRRPTSYLCSVDGAPAGDPGCENT